MARVYFFETVYVNVYILMFMYIDRARDQLNVPFLKCQPPCLFLFFPDKVSLCIHP